MDIYKIALLGMISAILIIALKLICFIVFILILNIYFTAIAINSQ